MEPKPGARISRKAFIQAVVIIFALMMFAGIQTRVVPPGNTLESRWKGAR